jgi:hypothetical protein
MRNRTKASIEQTNKYHTSIATSTAKVAALKRRRRQRGNKD